MNMTETPAIPLEVMKELEEACADAISGVRRPAKQDAAIKELEEGREEIRRRLGVLDLASVLTDRDG